MHIAGVDCRHREVDLQTRSLVDDVYSFKGPTEHLLYIPQRLPSSLLYISHTTQAIQNKTVIQKESETESINNNR